MRTTIARAACAFALAVPLLVATAAKAGAHDYPAESDCNGPYGAITDQPSPNRDCVGLDLHDRHHGGDHHGGHHNGGHHNGGHHNGGHHNGGHHNGGHHNGGHGGGEWYGPGPGQF